MSDRFAVPEYANYVPPGGYKEHGDAKPAGVPEYANYYPGRPANGPAPAQELQDFDDGWTKSPSNDPVVPQQVFQCDTCDKEPFLTEKQLRGHKIHCRKEE